MESESTGGDGNKGDAIKAIDAEMEAEESGENDGAEAAGCRNGRGCASAGS